jgi:hypothetical protein
MISQSGEDACRGLFKKPNIQVKRCSGKELSILESRFFNYLPSNIKNLSYEEKQFRLASIRFLLMNSLYALGEYFNWKLLKDHGSLEIYFTIKFYKLYNSVH